MNSAGGASGPDHITLRAAGGRFAVVAGALSVLTLMMAFYAATSSGDLVWRFILLCFALAAAYATYDIWQKSKWSVTWDGCDLTDSAGDVIASLDNMAKVDRGAFALKPSNGFAVLLKTSAATRWVPGIWWRIGKRVGVGGMVSAAPARAMADAIALAIETSAQK